MRKKGKNSGYEISNPDHRMLNETLRMSPLEGLLSSEESVVKLNKYKKMY